ncbi:hypothetical protein YPPY64_3052, partial [Yersinia pestis PY-64]
RHPWRGRFTPLPILTVQDRVIGVCQQSETPASALAFLLHQTRKTGSRPAFWGGFPL